MDSNTFPGHCRVNHDIPEYNFSNISFAFKRNKNRQLPRNLNILSPMSGGGGGVS